MMAATLGSAQAEAMKAAASNPNGAMMGFMGLNMAGVAGSANIQDLLQMGNQRQQAQRQQQYIPEEKQAQPIRPSAQAGSWQCSCGAVNTGKFCMECGTAKPEEGWRCSCGALNKGKFCSECGSPRPAAAKKYRCDKCGWEPEDPTNPPRFCPECGDPFNDGDIVQ